MGTHFLKTAHDKSLETWRRIGDTTPKVEGTKIHHGHATTRKLKYVCRKCNNGWMSIMESVAKPILEPMVLGNSITLDENAQVIIAEWLTLKMILYEHTDQNRPIDGSDGTVFSRDDALAFHSTREMPENLRIWLFHSDLGALSSRVVRVFTCLLTAEQILVAAPRKANVQTVLFGAGKLLAFFAHSTIEEFELGDASKEIAQRIYPPVRPSAIWPPMNSLTLDQATAIAWTLDNYVRRPGKVRVECQPIGRNRAILVHDMQTG